MALLIVHLLMGVAFSFVMIYTKTSMKPLHLGYAVMGALLFMMVRSVNLIVCFKKHCNHNHSPQYLAYDTQLILGGRKHTMSPEEYILGAIALYLDIINIFLYMLQIMNISSK